MKVKKNVILTALASLVTSAALLSGCAEGNVPGVIKQVNEQSVPMDGITNLKIDFGVKNITLLSTEGDTLGIRDYMAKDNDDYYSAVSVSEGMLTVSATRQNIQTSKVEITIPKSYKGAFSMSLASGEVYAETDLMDYKNISLALQNGYMHMRKMEAQTISLEVANGTIKAESTKGNSSFSVQSGTIVVLMDEFADDLTLNAASGTLNLTLPHDAAFYLDADAGRGTVKVTGGYEKVHVSGETVSKTIGMSPEHTITASAESGTVNIFMK
ncbi:MAG: DUF4097 domain-containing protein [Syntrophomonadaceae bacterium]|jgi:hypothetical protein|nr:DUF4097 domain-containing protein [Syntrophomonadaceae bacterium]